MFGRKSEKRSNPENPDNPITPESFLEFFGWGQPIDGVTVNVETALSVPAVLAAVSFLSDTIASLPLDVFEIDSNGNSKKLKSGIQNILHDAVSDEMTSYAWRQAGMFSCLTSGRWLTYIEKTSSRVLNLFPMGTGVSIKRRNFKTTYSTDSSIYTAEQVIDIPFLLKSDALTSVSPIASNSETIGLAIAATRYGSKFFNNGGVPPFVMSGNFKSGKGLERASSDIDKSIKDQSKSGKVVLTLPNGHEIKTIGADPEKSQLVELKRFLIEEIARIYSLPPVFLQDLTHGTFSNTEQQDLHLVKHTIRQWAKRIEQELNLKLFGRNNTRYYTKLNLDGLLRGDFTTRMNGYATGIQNAIITPDEARASENREGMGGEAEKLHIQGATVPLGSQNMSTGDVSNG